MKIALLGRQGQVSTEIERRLPADISLDAYGLDKLDFSKPGQVTSVVEALDVDAVINAAAYTAVDKAEEETELANTINGTAVRHLGEACHAKGIPVVHISTDYVFPGDGERPFKPDDAPGPLGIYGSSKLLGEEGLKESGARHVTMRTSWVFSAHGNNFVKTMLRFGAERDQLKVVNDQIGGPTPAADIADACLTIARALADGHSGGTYHFSGAPDVSWADFAREIFRQSGLTPEVAGIPTTEYPTPAKRPLNSRMDCSSIKRDFNLARPDWTTGLTDVLKELGAQ